MIARQLYVKIPKPKTATTVSFFVLVVMAVFGLITIRNVNDDFTVRQLAGKLQQYKYATLAFKNIYSALPGDISNATFYWKDITSDGNGDGFIEHANREGILAWQHMQLAKLIDLPAQMTGQWNSKAGEGVLVPNENIPGIDQEAAGFFVTYSKEIETHVFGIATTEGKKGLPNKAYFTPDQAFNLDLMIDDGYPETGYAVAISESRSGCWAVGEYKKENEIKECVMLFKF